MMGKGQPRPGAGLGLALAAGGRSRAALLALIAALLLQVCDRCAQLARRGACGMGPRVALLGQLPLSKTTIKV